MFCPSCGSQIEKNAAFCPECGGSVGTARQEEKQQLPKFDPSLNPRFTRQKNGPIFSFENFLSFINFDILIYPVILKWLYLISSILSTIITFVLLISMFGFGGFLASLIVAPLVLVLIRIGYEITMVFFNILRELKRANEAVK